MMLVKSVWNNKETFKMMPIEASCPYVECLYDPESDIFVVISKIKKTTLTMLPKLDDYGQPVTGNKGQRQDRHKMEVFQEFYLDDKQAISDIISLFAYNLDSFDYKSYYKKAEITAEIS